MVIRKSAAWKSFRILRAITGLTQNAGSEKKEPSSNSYNDVDVMKELEKQRSKKRIHIQVGHHYRQSADELEFVLAENLGFKADNIKNVKNHIFYNEHDLDRYGPDEIEHKRFDATLEQALAWKRLEALSNLLH
jgi:hypothetical protein